MLVIAFFSTVDGVDGGACSDLSYTKWVGLMQFDIFSVSRQKTAWMLLIFGNSSRKKRQRTLSCGEG